MKYYKSPRRFLALIGGKNVRTTRFISISSGTTGTVTLPTASTVILDDFGGTVDAVVTTISGGRPTFQAAQTSAGVIVSATFDSSGNYVLSGTPSAYPVALVYRIYQALDDFDSTSSDIIGDYDVEDGVTVGSPVFSGTANSILYSDVSRNLAQTSTFVYDSTTGFMGLGTASPAAKFHMAGNVSSAAWTTSGIGIRSAAATYTDTSSSGAISNTSIHALLRPTINSTSVTTYTTASTLYIANSPLQSGNATITTPLSIHVASGDCIFNGSLGIGASAATPIALLQINGNFSSSAWTTNGIRLRAVNRTYTDISSSGVVTSVTIDALQTPTIASSSAVTYTNASTLTITGRPTAGTNVTITNGYGLLVGGNVKFDDWLRVSTTGTSPPLAQIDVGGTNISGFTHALTGVGIKHRGNIFTDTVSSGTLTSGAVHSLGTSTLATSSALTITNAALLYLSAAVAAGSNVTIGNAYTIWSDSGVNRLDGNVQIGCTGTSIGALSVNGGVAFNYRVDSGTTVTVTTTDHVVNCTNTGARTVVLPTLASTYETTNTVGMAFIIRDGAGTALTDNITINEHADDGSTFVTTINTDGGTVRIYNIAGAWAVIT
jgi:hypothetical protein